eukprot:COSAG06_NODE_571_length_14101_cov_12.481682_9_plen_217_part_00
MMTQWADPRAAHTYWPQHAQGLPQQQPQQGRSQQQRPPVGRHIVRAQRPPGILPARPTWPTGPTGPTATQQPCGDQVHAARPVRARGSRPSPVHTSHACACTTSLFHACACTGRREPLPSSMRAPAQGATCLCATLPCVRLHRAPRVSAPPSHACACTGRHVLLAFALFRSPSPIHPIARCTEADTEYLPYCRGSARAEVEKVRSSAARRGAPSQA